MPVQDIEMFKDEGTPGRPSLRWCSTALMSS